MDLDNAGGLKRNLVNTIKKDTVTVPDGGYTVVRFTADNPGKCVRFTADNPNKWVGYTVDNPSKQ